MKDRPRPADDPERSRLDPEPASRRDFLGLAAKGTAAAAGGVALLGLLRLPKAAVLPSPSKRYRVNVPETLKPGEAFIPAGRQVALFREASGRVFAISIVCTHLGCIVQPTPAGFDCPCHGSRFGAGGEVVQGPAPKALPWLDVKKVAEGVYLVDEGKVVPGRKVKRS